MSPQIRISAPQRSSGRSNQLQTRSLLYSSEPPSSPQLKRTTCDALEIDNQPCHAALSTENEAWCNRHFEEMKSLNADWKQAQQKADDIEGPLDFNLAMQKVDKLRSAIDLRRQISVRFYRTGDDIADRIQWIMKLEQDVRAFADRNLGSSLAEISLPEIKRVTPTNAVGEPITVFQSPLNPQISIGALQSIPDNSTVMVLKRFYADFCASTVRRLYEIVPDLNDSPPEHSAASSGVRPPTLIDGGTNILRSWFRIMVFNESDAEVLEHATKAASIDEFLQGLHASQVETYVDFFEKAWRPHALQYLRVAIWAQTLTAHEFKNVRILGGVIPSNTEGLKMTKPCWDILYRWLPKLLTPWTLPTICKTFEDYTTICKLLMIGLYNKHWCHPKSILLECTTGVYLGFIPSIKVDQESLLPFATQKDSLVSEVQCRNYIIGQMAIGDSLTYQLLDELQKRTERLLLVVYEGTSADATVHPTEDDVFIKRCRSAKTKEELENVEWTTEVTLEDIKNTLRLRKDSMYNPLVVDSWQFIIIDGQPGLPFALFDIVQDTLLMLMGDLSPRQLARRVIQDIIPPAVREIFWDEVTLQNSFDLRYPPPKDIRYEGNRFRCWDSDRASLVSRWSEFEKSRTRDEDRFIMCVIRDMEEKGVISLAPGYEPPQTRPLVVQGTDGGLDLYFPYNFREKLPESPQSTAPFGALPSPNCLLEFARNFKDKHPNALMAKGSIQTHYCAWPMPTVNRQGKTALNFGTWQGHVYRWTFMPFDRPWAERLWQYYVHSYMNAKYPFIMFYLSSFIICATDESNTEEAMTTVLNEAEKRGWKLIIPPVRNWTSDIQSLNLKSTFHGIKPM